MSILKSSSNSQAVSNTKEGSTNQSKDTVLLKFKNLFLKYKKAQVDKNLPMIQVVNYTKKFRKFVANKNVSFSVGHGTIHGFIGPNGSGKTTTIKTLIGAYTLEQGKLLINGHKPGTVAANSLIGYIPERASFPSHLKCLDYLSEMGALSGMKYGAAKKKAKEILKDLGLEAFAKRKPISFSSGMQKKILLAQALLTDPSVLILDEPAANLDPTARKELFDELIKYRNQGKSVLISSHILSELERIIDDVTFLFYGEVLYTGSVENAQLEYQRVFFKTTDNEYTKKFLMENKVKVEGDTKTELYVDCADLHESEKLLRLISSDKKIIVQLFKTNDLQTIYDALLIKASKNKSGNQAIGGKKVIAQKEIKVKN